MLQPEDISDAAFYLLVRLFLRNNCKEVKIIDRF